MIAPRVGWLGLVLMTLCGAGGAQELAPGVRGLATRAPAGVKIDGDLADFRGAFCTPINYFHPQVKDRAAQFFYMWRSCPIYAQGRTG